MVTDTRISLEVFIVIVLFRPSHMQAILGKTGLVYVCMGHSYKVPHKKREGKNSIVINMNLFRNNS
jgi:hypothetical protein